MPSANAGRAIPEHPTRHREFLIHGREVVSTHTCNPSRAQGSLRSWDTKGIPTPAGTRCSAEGSSDTLPAEPLQPRGTLGTGASLWRLSAGWSLAHMPSGECSSPPPHPAEGERAPTADLPEGRCIRGNWDAGAAAEGGRGLKLEGGCQDPRDCLL